MSLRLTATSRKEYKTKEVFLRTNNTIPYLIWETYPPSAKVSLDTPTGTRVWVAGTSFSDLWVIKQSHAPGTPGWPKGGFTLIDPKKDEQIDVFSEEVIIHPKSKKTGKSH